MVIVNATRSQMLWVTNSFHLHFQTSCLGSHGQSCLRKQFRTDRNTPRTTSRPGSEPSDANRHDLCVLCCFWMLLTTKWNNFRGVWWKSSSKVCLGAQTKGNCWDLSAVRLIVLPFSLLPKLASWFLISPTSLSVPVCERNKKIHK